MSEAEMERLQRGDPPTAGARAGAEMGGGARSVDPDRRSRLERRYRWLLAAYPRDHQAEHAEEMLGVLMESAAEEQTRPGARESVNLVAGALRIRLRRITSCFVTPHWRDALAVLSVVAPLVALAMSLEAFKPRTTLFILGHFSGMERVPAWWFAGGLGQVPFIAGWVFALALVALGKRRGALVAVTATMIVQMLIMAWIAVGDGGWWLPIGPFTGADSPAGLFLGAVSIVALARSGGPRRGFQILGRLRTASIVAGLLAWTAAHSFAALLAERAIWGTSLVQGRVDWYGSIAAAFAAIPVAILCLRSPVGRRVMLLALPAASPFGVRGVTAALAGVPRYSPMAGDLAGGLYLLLTVAVVLLAVSSSSQARPGVPALGQMPPPSRRLDE